MSHPSPSLNDLISLNREIAAMIRAGIPLELGLRGFSGGGGGRLMRLSDRVADRMSNGQTLSMALAEEGPAVSPIYTAVVEAGIASGNLPRALESIADASELIQETRNRVTLALVYPAICLMVAYGSFCAFLVMVVPRLMLAREMFPKSWPIETLDFLSTHQRYFTMVIPAVVFAFVVVTIFLRNGILRSVWHRLVSFRWVMGSAMDWAQFSELLALQLEHNSPLPRSIVLAADATNNPRWKRESRAIAESLTRGATLKQSLESASSMPALTRWMLATGEKQGTLVETLRQLSDTYRRRAMRRAAILKVWFPVTLTAVLTAVIGLAYGLAFFIPLRVFLMGLAYE